MSAINGERVGVNSGPVFLSVPVPLTLCFSFSLFLSVCGGVGYNGGAVVMVRSWGGILGTVIPKNQTIFFPNVWRA